MSSRRGVADERKVGLNVNLPLPTSLPQNLGNVPGTITTGGTESKEELKAWVNELYTTQITESDLTAIYDALRYHGFDRVEVLNLLMKAARDTNVAIQLIILCALRGPQAAAKTKLMNGRTPIDMGIPASGGQGKTVLTCNKITAATADLAAYYLKRINVPKRMMMDLPGWLQFPSAGGIKLPARYRELHIEFHRRFSAVIGGLFNEQIYSQMESNSYLDERLNLFE